MLSVDTDKGKILLYDSIEDLPIRNWHLFNKYVLIQTGKGSTIEDLVSRYSRLDKFIGGGKIKEAAGELANLWQGMFDALNGLDYKSLAFGCLIYSIDAERVDDYSESGIHQILDGFVIDHISIGILNEHFESIKKKLILN